MSRVEPEPNLTREVQTQVKRAHPAGEPSVLALWGGILIGPIAVLANMQAAYALVSVVCGRWPVATMHAVHASMLVLAILAGLLALRSWRVAGRDWPLDFDGPIERSRFMGALGIMFSALSALIIAMQWVATIMLNPCQ